MDDARKYFLDLLKNKNSKQVVKEPETAIEDVDKPELIDNVKVKKKALKAKSKRMNGYNNRRR